MKMQRRNDLDGDYVDQSPDHTLYKRVWEIPTKGTLADASLEVGDTLPDDATAIIVAAKLDQAKRQGKAVGMCKVARVTAITLRAK